MSKFNILMSAAVFFLAIAMFGNTIGHEFVWDDFLMHQEVDELENPMNFKLFFTAKKFGVYRPLRMVVVSVIYNLWGLNSKVFHIINISLNAVVSLLLFWIALRVFKDRWKALAATVLFTVHPIHSEVVAYISGILDILSGALLFAALLCFLEEKGSEKPIRSVFGTLFFILALLTKELAVIFPLLLLAADLLVRKVPPGREIILKRLPLFLLSAIFLCVRFFLIGVVEQAKLIYGWAPSTVLPSVIKLIPYYLGELIYPAKLCPDFMTFKLAHSFHEPAVWGTVLGCAAALGVFVIALRRARDLAFGMAWFAVTALPFLHLVPTATFCADRYMYFPSAGFSIVLVWFFSMITGASHGKSSTRYVFLLLITCATAVFWGARTPAQSMVWKDEVTLYSAMTECAPESYFAYSKLGMALVKRKMFVEAEKALEKAVEISPRNVTLLINLGHVYGGLGKYEKAESSFLKASAIDPSDPDALFYLALVREKTGWHEGAIEACGTILDRWPKYEPARRFLEELQRHKEKEAK